MDARADDAVNDTIDGLVGHPEPRLTNPAEAREGVLLQDKLKVSATAELSATVEPASACVHERRRDVSGRYGPFGVAAT